jgi:hypothetical protein
VENSFCRLRGHELSNRRISGHRDRTAIVICVACAATIFVSQAPTSTSGCPRRSWVALSCRVSSGRQLLDCSPRSIREQTAHLALLQEAARDAAEHPFA